MAELILEEIKEEIGEVDYFSSLVDETKDLSKTKQISMVLICRIHSSRWVGCRHLVPVHKEKHR